MYEENDLNFTVLSHEQPYKTWHSQGSDTAENVSISMCWQNIPLKKTRQLKDITYISALPQWLLANSYSKPLLNRSKRAEKTLEETALKIVSAFKKIRFKSIASEPDHKTIQYLQALSNDYPLWLRLGAQFQIETQQLGCLSIRLSNDGISQWLQQVNASVLTDSARYDLPPANPCSLASAATAVVMSDAIQQQLWQAQYAHARCCSLLSLWQQFSLPDLSTIAHARLSEYVAHLLASSQSVQRGRGASRCAEAQLIHALISTADDMFWIPYRFPSKQYLLLLKSVTQLCKAFEGFYSAQLSGFGQISDVDNESMRSHISSLWQAKFYLVLTTKNILEALLTRHLHSRAPAEL